MKIKSSLFVFAVILCVFSASCDFNFYDKFGNRREPVNYENATDLIPDITDENEKIIAPDNIERQWTILIYMAADNNLESAALEDIFEMETSNLDTDKVSVFILLDRSRKNNTANGNTAGAMLYQLKTGRKENCSQIISNKISCRELGISDGTGTELDMSSPYVLSDSISFIRDNYPANNYGLILWGHGTGWRNKENTKSLYKGFAYDETSNTYMTLRQLKIGLETGLKGDKLNLLGFDTCFSGELEVMYELRNQSDYIAGTAGLLEMKGWNYNSIFNSFEKEKIKNAQNFACIIVDSFSEEYKKSVNASIVAVDLSKINDYFLAFDKFMKSISESIKTAKERDYVINKIFYNDEYKSHTFCYGENNSDLYIDIDYIINNLSLIFPNGNNINDNRNNYINIRNKCILRNWASFNSSCSLGVYFGQMSLGNTISGTHPQGYIKNNSFNQIDFVKDSIGYVPTADHSGSFLDKIFY